MEVFKRERHYAGALKREGETNRWISDKPLFRCGDKGLFPVFRTGGPTGNFPKNHQELILRNIGGDDVRSGQTFTKRKKEDFFKKI